MVRIDMNKKLLPMKMNFFFYFGCLGPMYGFLPTIARQLGYSLTTYGTVMMVLSVVSMITNLTVGIVVDKYRVKRLLFLLCIILYGVFEILFMFMPKLPTDMAVKFECATKTTLTVSNIENILQNDENKTISVEQTSDEWTMCELDCQENVYYNNIHNLINQTYSCDNLSTINIMENPNQRSRIDIGFKHKDTEKIGNSYIFHVLSIQSNGTQMYSTTCSCPVTTLCNINCTNQVITQMATNRTYRGNVLKLHQFWIFFILIILLFCCIATINILQHSISLSLLEDKTENYGKIRCFSSIGWGLTSMCVGWLVDKISMNKIDKNYSPIFYSCIILTLVNIGVTAKIKVVETSKTVGKWTNVFQLLAKRYVIGFFVWNTLNTLLHIIVIYFLFWYMEDMVAKNGDQSQRTWIKTIQGLAQGIQCFGGEVPFYFWSSWMIKKMGHVYCMAFVLGVMAVRMYLYTIITNPIWVILIELLNGTSYALGLAVKMSYVAMIAPPGTTNTLIGLIGFFDCVGESAGSILGGYIYDLYGGAWLFRLFAYCSALMCFLNILSNLFGLTKDVKNCNFVAVATKADNKEPIEIDK